MSSLVERDVLQHIREQAQQRFDQLGWPATQLEEWQYTNLAPLQKWRATRVGDTAGSNSGQLSRLLAALPTEANGFRYGERAVAELVFVNGVYAPAASRGVAAFAGKRGPAEAAAPLHITTLRDADPAVLEEHFARYADYQRHALTALNTARAQDGVVITADDAVTGFVHLLFIGSEGFESHPRNLIVAGRGSQISIVETYIGSGKYFTNTVTEIVARQGAVIDHTRLECESLEAFHVGTVQVHQERSSTVTARNVSIGGALVRNETNVVLGGEGASVILDGLFVLAGTQHVDNHTVMDHAVPHCDSLELYKGILDQNSRGIFDGTIIVRPGAQKTASRQTNHNLLLSEGAIIDSKPTLEIYNDDVKCNHGSTIGQIEEAPMFYLRSRGISENEARSMLVHAFASEIVDRMKVEPVREQIRRVMFRQQREAQR